VNWLAAALKKNAYNNIGLLDGDLLPYEVLFDGPYIKYVKPLVAQYPDAKFILHVRRSTHGWRVG
jgi:hypothetical protein